MEPQNSDEDDQVCLKKSDHHSGQGLAEQNFDRTEWRHEELVKGSCFALPGDGKGCDHHRHHQREKPHDPRNDKPSALQVGVEPRADVEFCRGWRIPVGFGPLLIEPRENGAQVARGQHGRVGVSAVDDHLER